MVERAGLATGPFFESRPSFTLTYQDAISGYIILVLDQVIRKRVATRPICNKIQYVTSRWVRRSEQ